MIAKTVVGLCGKLLRLLIQTTPAIPKRSPAILRNVNLSASQIAANTAPNIGDIELKIASIEEGASAATE